MTTDVPLLPGGYGRSSYFLGAPPPTLVRGEGHLVYDEAGDAKIDLNGNYTVLVHGHGFEPVRREIIGAANDGICFGAPNRHELEHAAILVGRIPGAEQVRYTNSGTEAVMTAIRVARAHTGRSLVIMQSPAYHGTADTALPAMGAPGSRGLPAGVTSDILTIPPGNVDALLAAVDDAGERLAAIVLDLMPTSSGARALPADFVQAARASASSAGALFIVDEVISFRLAPAGFASSGYGLQPDLLALGKLIGGGLPVGAVAGSRDAMAVLDPFNPEGIIHGGTFAANAATMRAGRAALDHLDASAIAGINELGDRLRAGLHEVVARIGWAATGHGSIVRLAPAEGDTPERRRAMWWLAYDHGVLLTVSGLLSVSTVMTDEIVDEAVERIAAGIDATREAL